MKMGLRVRAPWKVGDRLLKRITLIWILLASVLSPPAISANQNKHFALGEVVFVAFPVGNIKNDAFIVGKIQSKLANGDYVVSVLDYVKGHDYGSSCVPMIKKEDPNATALGYEKGWEMWKDTTQLETKVLDYVVPGTHVMSLGGGKHYFVERNNLYIVFGRWKSDAPVMTLDRIERAQNEAKAIRLTDLVPVFELIKYHRKTFYDASNRPLYPFERIEPAIEMVKQVEQIFTEQPRLYSLWKAKERDWVLISKSSYDYFMIDAIDKVLSDARDQAYEVGVETAGEDKVKTLLSRLNKLVRDK